MWNFFSYVGAATKILLFLSEPRLQNKVGLKKNGMRKKIIKSIQLSFRLKYAPRHVRKILLNLVFTIFVTINVHGSCKYLCMILSIITIKKKESDQI